jgi:hypothetical protein
MSDRVDQPRKEAKGRVTLACGHSAHFPFPLPRPGETLWCRTCDEPRVVRPPDAATPTTNAP